MTNENTKPPVLQKPDQKNDHRNDHRNEKKQENLVLETQGGEMPNPARKIGENAEQAARAFEETDKKSDQKLSKAG